MIEDRFIPLISQLPEAVFRRNLDWAQITTLGIGGPLSLVAEPRNSVELEILLGFCSKEKIHPVILGGGSNLCGGTPNHPFLVIRIAHGDFLSFEMDCEGILTAGSALPLRRFVVLAGERGYGGLSALSAIPGRIGGALVMNAGAHGVTIGDFLQSVEWITFDGKTVILSATDLVRGYRDGGIPQDAVITQASFILPKSNAETVREEMACFSNLRAEKEPKGRTAGCLFRNPSPSISAGRLLDRAGLKGFKVGGISLSSQHANYAVNDGTATEADLLKLIEQSSSYIYQTTGIRLEPEIRRVNPEQPTMTLPPPLKIAVLKGGDSSEREISLKSGAAVAEALRTAGFSVIEIDLPRAEITEEMRQSDVVFPVLHGGFGENGEIQALLETADIPFVGCGSETCRLVMDKIATKKWMDAHAIPNAAWTLRHRNAPDQSIPSNMTLPLVVKAPSQGSSVGVTIVKTPEAWSHALEVAYQFGDDALIEAFVKGTEVTVGVINGDPLPLVELRFKGEFYDYDAKYTYKNGQTEYLCPPPDLPEAVQRLAQKYAVTFAKACGMCDLIRVDFIIDAQGIPYALEGNAIPGFTASSLVPKAAKASGISFPELCAKLVMRCAQKAGLIG